MAVSLPFTEGQLVVVVLREPRERVWGRLAGLESAGIAMRGLDLQCWEESLGFVKRGQAAHASLATRFFPMHRVESLYLDEPSSGVPSLAADFARRTGVDPQAFLLGAAGAEALAPVSSEPA